MPANNAAHALVRLIRPYQNICRGGSYWPYFPCSDIYPILKLSQQWQSIWYHTHLFDMCHHLTYLRWRLSSMIVGYFWKIKIQSNEWSFINPLQLIYSLVTRVFQTYFSFVAFTFGYNLVITKTIMLNIQLKFCYNKINWSVVIPNRVFHYFVCAK